MVQKFQSTPPVKAATYPPRNGRCRHDISIHAAREGGDAPVSSFKKQGLIFQSTPPVKAATGALKYGERNWQFQSTPPVKAATFADAFCEPIYVISIHAAREGGDCGNE